MRTNRIESLKSFISELPECLFDPSSLSGFAGYIGSFLSREAP